MKKKKLLAAVIALFLLTPVLASAASTGSGIWGNPIAHNNEEWTALGTPLKVQMIHRMTVPFFSDESSPYATDYHNYGARVYYDRKGNAFSEDEVMDEGLYYYAFPYYNGMAAVVTPNNGKLKDAGSFLVGYVDASGREAIPCQYEGIPTGQSGVGLVGRFLNGYAYVFRDVEAENFKISFSAAKIDKTGTVVSAWESYHFPYKWTDMDDPVNDQARSVFKKLGVVSADNDYTTQYLYLRNQWGTGNDALDFRVPVDCSAFVAPVFQWEPFKKTGVIVDMAKLDQPKISRFQSTAQLTSVSIAELDFDKFTITVTNSTDCYDSGTVALVLASGMGTIHFVDYELAPKESKDYDILVAGHVGVGFDQFMVVLGKGWGAYLNADIITFESDEDLNTYRDAVVYEKNLDYFVTQGSADNISAKMVICNGQPGDQWLKNYTGIGRHDKPLANSAVTHDICGK